MKRGISAFILLFITLIFTAIFSLFVINYVNKENTKNKELYQKINKFNKAYFYTDQSPLVGVYGNKLLSYNSKDISYSLDKNIFILSIFHKEFLDEISKNEIVSSLYLYPLSLFYLFQTKILFSTIFPQSLKLNAENIENLLYVQPVSEVGGPVAINYTSIGFVEYTNLFSIYFPPIESMSSVIKVPPYHSVVINENVDPLLLPAFVFVYAKNFSSFTLYLSKDANIKCNSEDKKCVLYTYYEGVPKAKETKTLNSLKDLIVLLLLKDKVKIITKNETISFDVSPSRTAITINFKSEGLVAYPSVFYSPVVDFSCIHYGDPLKEFCFPTFFYSSDLLSIDPSFDYSKIKYITNYLYSEKNILVPVGFINSNIKITKDEYIINNKEYSSLKVGAVEIIPSEKYLEELYTQ